MNMTTFAIGFVISSWMCLLILEIQAHIRGERSIYKGFRMLGKSHATITLFYFLFPVAAFVMTLGHVCSWFGNKIGKLSIRYLNMFADSRIEL